MTILDQAYRRLVADVLQYGHKRPSRVGETISLPGQSLTAAPVADEFPILTTRKIYTKGIIGELAAFIQGATTLQAFRDFSCNYWDHNAKQWPPNEGVPPEVQSVGRIYGAQWRRWGRTGLDQLQSLIDGIKTDAYGRRHIMTTWNPEELDGMCLPPCHLLVQFYVRDNAIDAIIYMRSVDLALGLPSDLVLYGALLMLVAKAVDLPPGRLYFQFGDAHVYVAHLEQLKEQQKRVNARCRPKAHLKPGTDIFSFTPDQFTLHNYEPMEPISYVLL